MKVLVVLALAVFTAGCNANIVWQNKPKQQVDMVKDAFWDYVAKATMTAEGSLKQIRESELGKEVNIFIATSTDVVNRFTDNLRTQAAPLTRDLLSKFSQQTELLKARVEKDLSSAGASLQPYAEELLDEIQSKVSGLSGDVAPYAKAMDPEALKAVLLQKSQELKVQLDQSVAQLQAQMVPYTEEIKQKMEQSLEEFQESMIPLTHNLEAQLVRKSQEIQEQLAPYGEELKAKLDADTENMKRQLAALWESFSKLTQ